MVDVSIIIPTFNEGGNVPELVRRLASCFPSDTTEVIFVDDSTDDTPEVILGEADRHSLPIRVLHREGPARVGGLSGAVVDGIRASRGSSVLVMDGDLQHPPEVAVSLTQAVHEREADLVLASRYTSGGDPGGLDSRLRHAVSQASTGLAGLLFPRRVGAVCSDPMTGFFCFRRAAVDVERLRPRGFKILLEILARHPLRVAEVPFHFAERGAGESKANWRNGLAFLNQVVSLRLGRWSRLAVVGAIGLLLNLLLMAGALHIGVPLLAASFLATELTILGNFLLQERFVFGDLRVGGPSWRSRLLQTLGYNNLDALIRAPFLLALVQHGTPSLAAQALTIGGSFVARAVFTHRVVYRQRGLPRPAPAADVPGPPSDAEKYAYLGSPQHRWVFWAQAGAFLGVAVSLYGLARNNYWTMAFLLPLLIMIVEQGLALRTSTFRRAVTFREHVSLVDGYAPERFPSVDVFLPTAGEPVDLLANTYSHVARLTWPGRLHVVVLDDAARAEVRTLAEQFGFTYLARPGSEFKKAGNLQYGLERTDGEHVTILDADFVPRPDYLLELVPYLQHPDVGIVQSPQYFDTSASLSWLERCAGATQELFYRFIQPSRDAVGAAICVGTSAVYRRAALNAIGGFPLIGHSEDVYTGVHLGRVGYRLSYVPVLVTRGKSPDDLSSFVNQQYRWCEGSMSLMADPQFHLDESLTVDQRLSFWSGFVYYITTAMNAVLAPLAVLVMVWFFPDRVASVNMVPLLGAIALWLVVLPWVSHGRWRLDVLRVQTVYGFAHLFCILDLSRGRAAEWIATNARAAAAPAPPTPTPTPTPARASRLGDRERPLSTRVRTTMGAYLALSQVAVLAGLVRGAAQFGIGHYWANVVLAALNAYVFVPVAWSSWRGRPVDAAAPRLGTAGVPAVRARLRRLGAGVGSSIGIGSRIGSGMSSRISSGIGAGVGSGLGSDRLAGGEAE